MNFVGDFAVLHRGNIAMRNGLRISSLVPSGLVVESVSDSIELNYPGRPIGSIESRMPVVRGGGAPNS